MARLKLSAVAMSGRGAPSRTGTPTPTRPSSARLPGTILPARSWASSAGADRMTTSAWVPWRSLSSIMPTVPKVVATTAPSSSWKRSAISLTASVTAPALNTRSSADRTVEPVTSIAPAAAAAIGANDVAGKPRRYAAADRTSDIGTQQEIEARRRGDDVAEDRQRHLFELAALAHRPIGDDPGAAARQQPRDQYVAERAGPRLALRVDHEHGARRDILDRDALRVVRPGDAGRRREILARRNEAQRIGRPDESAGLPVQLAYGRDRGTSGPAVAH